MFRFNTENKLLIMNKAGARASSRGSYACVSATAHALSRLTCDMYI